MTSYAQFESDVSSVKREKTKEDYSRNVKKLKYKLGLVSEEISALEAKIHSFTNTSNDKVISMKISKFCKERRFTPEMLFRFADAKGRKVVTQSQFKDTLEGLGLKLSKLELSRLEYLIDEDISGEISWEEYNRYLYAFGIKKEYSPEDPIMQGALQKLDLGKILNIDKDASGGRKYKKLMNYEQFLQYCHEHFPALRDKELASIFNKLSRNNLIDLEDLVDFLRKREREQRRLQEEQDAKNKRNKAKSAEDEDDEEAINIHTRKGVIRALLKYHPVEQRNFHSSEFQRLEKIYAKDVARGSLVSMFRQIDRKKVQGSIGYNQIIEFFICEEKQKNSKDLIYAFELMGKKLISEGEKPQSLIDTFASGEGAISRQEFEKMMASEFDLETEHCNLLFGLVTPHDAQTAARKQPMASIKALVAMMKIGGQFKPTVKPSLWNTYPHHFYSRTHLTILTDPFVALRFCMSIAEQLRAMKQPMWDDFEFGPTFEDPNGYESLRMDSISLDKLKWVNCRKLGMKDFYVGKGSEGRIFESGSMCKNDLFGKALQTSLNLKEGEFFHVDQKDLNKTARQLGQAELEALFKGVYPLAFHDFAKEGIYVIRLYSSNFNKWVYVMVDEKIPCDHSDGNQPIFSYVSGRNCSFVSLIEKATAKLKNSYSKLYGEGHEDNLGQYINQLTAALPCDYKIKEEREEAKENQQHDSQWRSVKEIVGKEVPIIGNPNQKMPKGNNQKSSEVPNSTNYRFSHVSYLMNRLSGDREVKSFADSGVDKNWPLRVRACCEIPDKSANNSHESHRLLMMDLQGAELKPQSIWNPKWQSYQPEDKNNKFSKFKDSLAPSIKEWNIHTVRHAFDLQNKNHALVNYQKCRQMFNTLLCLREVSFEEMVVQRKVVEFEQNLRCSYLINCTEKTEKMRLILSIAKLKAPGDAVVKIENRLSSERGSKEKARLLQASELKGSYGCFLFEITPEEHHLTLGVDNFKKDEDHAYQLTFYFSHPRYSLKERDRHLLFRYVSQYQEHPKLDVEFKSLEEKEKQYIYGNFYKAAQKRTGILCC